MELTPEQLAADESTSLEELTKLARQSIELASLVASNVNANFELLQELYSYNDRSINEGIASNPNTPPKILVELLKTFPQQVVSNPIFPLLLLENPNFIKEEILRDILIVLLQQKELPEFFVNKALKSQSDLIRYILAQRQDLSELILEKLAQDNIVIVRLAVAENPKTSINILKKLALDTNDFVCLTAAKIIVNRLNKSSLRLTDLSINYKGSSILRSSDLDIIATANNTELKRLGWTRKKGRDFFMQNFDKQPEFTFSNQELFEFWKMLRAIVI